jgi:hypothetical protein
MQKELKEALEIVIQQDPDKGDMAYAQLYANAALSLGESFDAEVKDNTLIIDIRRKPTGKEMIGEELRVQLLYVLSNLASWRGEEARKVKEIIKKYSK